MGIADSQIYLYSSCILGSLCNLGSLWILGVLRISLMYVYYIMYALVPSEWVKGYGDFH